MNIVAISCWASSPHVAFSESTHEAMTSRSECSPGLVIHNTEHFLWPPTPRGPHSPRSGLVYRHLPVSSTGRMWSISAWIHNRVTQQLPQRHLPPPCISLCSSELRDLKMRRWMVGRCPPNCTLQRCCKCEQQEKGSAVKVEVRCGDEAVCFFSVWVFARECLGGEAGVSVPQWHSIKGSLCSYLWEGAAVSLSTTQRLCPTYWSAPPPSAPSSSSQAATDKVTRTCSTYRWRLGSRLICISGDFWSQSYSFQSK